MEILIEKGANVNAVNKDGVSVLDNASSDTTGNSKTIPTTKSMNVPRENKTATVSNKPI